VSPRGVLLSNFLRIDHRSGGNLESLDKEDNMKRVVKIKLKNVILFLMCLGFVSAILLPGPALAVPTTASGTASLDWTNAVWTGFDSLIWSDQNSLSGSWVGLNGVETDSGDSDFVEAAWASTSFTASLSDLTGSVTGSAATSLSAINASSNIALNTGPSFADVFIAQAVLTGQFTVAAPVTLSLTVPYALSLSVASVPGGSAFAEAVVGLKLSNFDITDPATGQSLILFSDEVNRNNLTFDPNLPSGFLSLSLSLDPLITYDFEASASTVASATAPVPEPATMLLLGSGLFGLGALRKRIRIQRSNS
jgi:hypothetical protein